MKPSRVSKSDVEQDLQRTTVNKDSPPLPNLKEILQFVKDLRDPVNQEYGGFNARAADLIEAQARVVAAAIALERGGQLCGENWAALRQALRAMRGNADE